MKFIITVSVFGSSPYIRGTFQLFSFLNAIFRFIPVYTGNILGANLIHLFVSVHPRIYGEHLLRLRQPLKWRGSSPYIRGTFYFVQKSIAYTRFIPVYTGNISPKLKIEGGATVHPRIYGEHTNTC